MLITLLVTTGFSGIIGVTPLFASSSTTSVHIASGQIVSSMTNANKQKYNRIQQETNSMMGHMGIANIALLYSMTSEAAVSVQKARVIACKLERQTSQLNDEIMKLGKIKIHTPTGESHDYWLPIENDTFVVNKLDSVYLKSKEPNAVEEDAQMVNIKAVLNTKQVCDSLMNAEAAINAKKYGDAQVALQNAQQSIVGIEILSTLPLITARDNLVLARELAKSKDYTGASFALNYAKVALNEYQKTANKEKSELVEYLQTEIKVLQKEIAMNKHPVITNVEKRISNWIKKIKAL